MTAAFRSGDVSRDACGARMRLVRAMRGETQEEFATQIGMKHKAYQSIEGGKAFLRPYYAKKVYDLTGVDANFIYFGSFAHLSVKLAGDLLQAASDQP